MKKAVSKSAGLTSDRIAEICDRLKANKRVRRNLPGEGRLHIDRQLPFLCVYRRPTDGSDSGTRKLVLGEASYLVTSTSPGVLKPVTQLLDQVVETLIGALIIGFEQITTFLSHNILPMPLLKQFLNLDLSKLSISNQENLALVRHQPIYVGQ